MIKKNNKGYMLVELILASALAFGMAYFLISLTMKLKDKNDDLLVTTLTKTDQAIITNIIMKDLYETNGSGFNCNDIKINGKNFSYKDKVNIVNKYATVGNNDCNISSDTIEITIPLNVPQLPNEDFNINIKYKK